MAKRLTIAAFVVAVLGAGLVTFAPLGRSCGVSDGGPERCRSWMLCVLGLASIGLYFVPAAVLLTVASAMEDQRSAFASG